VEVNQTTEMEVLAQYIDFRILNVDDFAIYKCFKRPSLTFMRFNIYFLVTMVLFGKSSKSTSSLLDWPVLKAHEKR
jgi:hypothetical protein